MFLEKHDVWIVYNIFINNYILYECTHRCITHSVTAHPDDGQTRPKHVAATNWENIYHLCILLVFIIGERITPKQTSTLIKKVKLVSQLRSALSRFTRLNKWRDSLSWMLSAKSNLLELHLKVAELRCRRAFVSFRVFFFCVLPCRVRLVRVINTNSIDFVD